MLFEPQMLGSVFMGLSIQSWESCEWLDSLRDQLCGCHSDVNMIFVALILIWNVYVFVQFMMQRMKEAELFKEWESQEDDVCSVLSSSTVFLTFELCSWPLNSFLTTPCYVLLAVVSFGASSAALKDQDWVWKRCVPMAILIHCYS